MHTLDMNMCVFVSLNQSKSKLKTNPLQTGAAGLGANYGKLEAILISFYPNKLSSLQTELKWATGKTHFHTDSGFYGGDSVQTLDVKKA